MAPEQARGKPVDKRADIWAFGCVLYEMLTGQRAFGGDDVTVTLSRVVEREPDFDALPATVPPRVRQALRVCLRKDPKQRAHDIADIRMALEGAFETVAATDDVSRVISATRTVGLGCVRRGSGIGRRSDYSDRAASARDPDTVATGNAHGDRDARHRPSRIVCALARRPADCLRRVG